MRRFRLASCSVAFLCVGQLAGAADGNLDPTFGTGGRAEVGFGDPLALAVASDGRIVVGGGLFGFGLARLHPDGTLDTTFGGDGIVSTTGEGERSVADVVILEDGKIIAVGYAQEGFDKYMRLIRYHPDGSIDTSYGTLGKVTVAFPGGAVSGNAVLQPDGKLLNAATESNAGGLTYSIALARFNPDGSLDPSFGSGGKTVTNFPDIGEYPTEIVLAPDGKFYVVGVAAIPADGGSYGVNWLIVRYLPDGSIDGTYGDGGRVVESFYSDYVQYGHPAGAALQPDGKLVVGGGSGGLFALARFDAGGELDLTFGTWGKTVVTSFPQVEAAGFARRFDGKLFLAGTSNRGPEGAFTPRGFALMAFDAQGRVDTTFAACPQVSTSFGTDVTQARTIALQADGKVLVAGGLPSGELAIARYGTPTTPECQPASSRSGLIIKDLDGVERDALKWTWRGEPVTVADLGDPTATTGYTLCVIDESAGSPTLRLGSPLMRAGWSAKSRGYAFSSSSDNDFPFTRARFTVSASNAGKLKLRARGEYLYPSLPLQPPVTVRFVREDDETCWEATYSTADANDGARFSARSD